MALDSDILLVSPLRVIATLLALAAYGAVWASLLGSMARILGGFFLAAALGTLLAALAARFKRVEEWLAPPVLAMKAVPVASFRHSGADLVRFAQPVRVHRAGDGVPGDLHQRAGGRPRGGSGAGGDGARVRDSPSCGASAASRCRRSRRISARAARSASACAGRRAWRRRGYWHARALHRRGACSRRRSTRHAGAVAWTLVIVAHQRRL